MFFASTLLALAAAPAAAPQEPATSIQDGFELDRLVAIVNDQTLTWREVEVEAVRFAQDRGIAPETPGLAGVVARNLLTDMIYAEGFRQAGLDETIVDQVINDEIERNIREFGSLAAYERHLASLGRNIEIERRTTRQTIVATYFQQAELGIAPELGGTNYRSFITVSPSEVQAYYEAEGGQFSFPRLTNVRILMVPARDDMEAARKIIDDARASSATDALAFARASEEHSLYGTSKQNLTGFVDPTTEGVVSSFRDFLATAQAGEISEAVEKSGYLVAVQMHQVQEAKQLTIGEAHRQIEAQLLGDKRLKALDEAFNQQRDRCYVWMIPQFEGILDDVYDLRSSASQEEL